MGFDADPDTIVGQPKDMAIVSKLHRIGFGRTHTRTHVMLLIPDLDVRIINAITGELLRELTIDSTFDYQPQTKDT